MPPPPGAPGKARGAHLTFVPWVPGRWHTQRDSSAPGWGRMQVTPRPLERRRRLCLPAGPAGATSTFPTASPEEAKPQPGPRGPRGVCLGSQPRGCPELGREVGAERQQDQPASTRACPPGWPLKEGGKQGGGPGDLGGRLGAGAPDSHLIPLLWLYPPPLPLYPKGRSSWAEAAFAFPNQRPVTFRLRPDPQDWHPWASFRLLSSGFPLGHHLERGPSGQGWSPPLTTQFSPRSPRTLLLLGKVRG